MALFIPIFEHDIGYSVEKSNSNMQLNSVSFGQFSNYFTLSMGLEISNSTIVEWQQNYTYTSSFSFARALRVVICFDYMYMWSLCTVYLVSFPVDCNLKNQWQLIRSDTQEKGEILHIGKITSIEADELQKY